MNTLTIKEDWKAPFSSPSYLNTFKQLLRFSFYGGLIIGIVFLVISFDTNAVLEGLKKGGLILVSCMLGGPVTLIVLYLIFVPIILLFQLPKIVLANTFEFCVGDGTYMIKKNGRPIIDIPLIDFQGYAFVVVTVNNMGGNALGNILKIKYLNKGKEKEKDININYMRDEKKVMLHQFMADVNAYNEDKCKASSKMNHKDEKLKELSDLAGKMKDEYMEKAKQGDGHALSRAGEMTMLQHWVEKVRNCEHDFEWKDGRRVCSKCGFEDPDSLSIEEKWADAWS